MKDQYFGDIRDLFKFDITFQILKKLNLNHFIFIPLLTQDDSRTDGSKTKFSIAKAGKYNADLSFFLQLKLKQKERKVADISDFFDYFNIKTKVIEDYFNNQSRELYFKKAIKQLMPSSLILLDPDNGIEVKNSNEKHVLFSEIGLLLNKIDDQSILMIYQHFSRENHYKFTLKKITELSQQTGINPLFISDNDILFFFLSKSNAQLKKVSKTLSDYKKQYKKLIIDIKVFQNTQGFIDFD